MIYTLTNKITKFKLRYQPCCVISKMIQHLCIKPRLRTKWSRCKFWFKKRICGFLQKLELFGFYFSAAGIRLAGTPKVVFNGVKAWGVFRKQLIFFIIIICMRCSGANWSSWHRARQNDQSIDTFSNTTRLKQHNICILRYRKYQTYKKKTDPQLRPRIKNF